MPAFQKHICSSRDELSSAVAGAILNSVNSTASDFSLALAGGSTPEGAYRKLAEEPLRSKMPWDRLRVFFGDERHVRPDHPDSNFRMAHQALLKHVPIPSENVFPIPTNDLDPEKCAEQFEQLLKTQFTAEKNFPVFDLILLGIGGDGHTASIFPGTPAVAERQRWAVAVDPNSTNPGVKPAVKRITLTLPVIWSARRVFVIAVGAEKAPILRDIFADNDPPAPPVARNLRACREIEFFMDEAAGANI